MPAPATLDTTTDSGLEVRLARFEEDLSKLNEQQRAAVEATEGYVLVFAGAGSGKTRVLTMRAANMVLRDGVDPSSILAITFTRKAANEMRTRLGDMLGDLARTMEVRTIHSFCLRVLRSYAPRIGFGENFLVSTDGADVRKLAAEVSADVDLPTDKDAVKDTMEFVAKRKNAGITPEAYYGMAKSWKEKSYARFYDLMQRRMRDRNLMDFDDILLYTQVLLTNNPDVLQSLSERYAYVSVDEYQDTNVVQDRIVTMLTQSNGNLMVVGDDDQAIYTWRGAEPENIISFARRHPRVQTFRLEQNYRSTGHIVSAASSIVSNNVARAEKTLRTDAVPGERVKVVCADNDFGERDYLVRSIMKLHREGVPYSSMAVLYRINAISRSLEQAFVSNGIPYVINKGMSFLSREEVKAALSYLRLFVNPFDSASFRYVISRPRRGVGTGTVNAIETYARDHAVSLVQAAGEVADIAGYRISKKGREGLREFSSMYDFYAAADEWVPSVSELLEQLLDASGLARHYAEAGEEYGNDRIANLLEVVSMVGDVEGNVETDGETLHDRAVAVLDEIATMSAADEVKAVTDSVTLMTIHAAKGLEYPKVFVVGMDDGIFPHKARNPRERERMLEDERRLLYVAVTRAQELCVLMHAEVATYYGKTDYYEISPFIEEMSDDDVERIYC